MKAIPDPELLPVAVRANYQSSPRIATFLTTPVRSYRSDSLALWLIKIIGNAGKPGGDC
jgi:hypothetical protein